LPQALLLADPLHSVDPPEDPSSTDTH
jgi:hypothetical protein